MATTEARLAQSLLSTRLNTATARHDETILKRQHQRLHIL